MKTLKQLVAPVALALGLGAPAQAQMVNYATDMEPLVGQMIASVHDFNKDGAPDEVRAFVHRDVNNPKNYRIEVFASLTTPGQYKRHGGLIDVFVLPQGQCIDLAEKKDKLTGLWDAYLLQYPCKDYDARTVHSRYRNTGDGFVKQ